MRIARITIAAASIVVLLSGSRCDPGPEGQISHAIKTCASTEAVGAGQIIYTGPVGVGPGSRWVRLNADLLKIAAEAKDIFGKVPTDPDFMAPPPGTGANCDIASTKKTNLGGDLGVSVATLPISVDLKAKIGNSANVIVTVEAFEWHDVKFDVYNALLKALPEASPFKHPAPGRFTAVSMLKVKDYTATVDVAKNTDLGLGVGYKGPLPASVVGDVKANVTATVTEAGKLVIKVPGESYVAGIFRPINGSTGTTESVTRVTGTPNDWSVVQSGVEGSRDHR